MGRARPLTEYVSPALWERMLQYREVDSVTGCWNWKRSTRNGYGQIRLAERVTGYVHRIALTVAGVELGALVVCHRCDNPLCFNPEHLFVGTQSDNMRDAVEKGRPIGRNARKSA